MQNTNNLQLLLCGNNITNFDEAFALYNDIKFHTLDLSNNLKDFVDTNTLMVASDLQSSGNCKDILQLHLQMNNLCDTRIEAPFKVLKLCSNLLVLNVSYNKIGEDGAVILGDALKHCIKLHKLDISSNNLCSYGAEAIAEGLKYCTYLLDLKINSCQGPC